MQQKTILTTEISWFITNNDTDRGEDSADTSVSKYALTKLVKDGWIIQNVDKTTNEKGVKFTIILNLKFPH